MFTKKEYLNTIKPFEYILAVPEDPCKEKGGA